MADKTIAWIVDNADWLLGYKVDIGLTFSEVTFKEFYDVSTALNGLLGERYDLIVVDAMMTAGIDYPKERTERHGDNPRRFTLDMVERIRETRGPNQRTPLAIISSCDFGGTPDDSFGRSFLPEYRALGVECLFNRTEELPVEFTRMVGKYLK